jgi:hypothetical protein
MYSGFFMHSPRAAHFAQLSFSSVQLPRVWCTLSNEATRIHFVADHFSPFMTGHPAWRLIESVVPSGLRLKKRRASPLRGFTGEEVAYPLRSMPKMGIQKPVVVRKLYLQCLSENILTRLHLYHRQTPVEKSTENCLIWDLKINCECAQEMDVPKENNLNHFLSFS